MVLGFELWHGKENQYYREFAPLFKPSPQYSKMGKLYNQRSSVERVNYHLKIHLTANQLHLWGIEKVKTH
jgi:hypothetical protein